MTEVRFEEAVPASRKNEKPRNLLEGIPEPSRWYPGPALNR